LRAWLLAGLRWKCGNRRAGGACTFIDAFSQFTRISATRLVAASGTDKMNYALATVREFCFLFWAGGGPPGMQTDGDPKSCGCSHVVTGLMDGGEAASF